MICPSKNPEERYKEARDNVTTFFSMPETEKSKWEVFFIQPAFEKQRCNSGVYRWKVWGGPGTNIYFIT